jgi:cellulose synthase/poly-beta-1,6-N-acetylglucosamine synthase-like glycosyltransferase
LIEGLLCAFALAMLVPVSLLLAQVLMALPPYRPRAMPSVRRPGIALVIPAHDEASVIDGTLRSVVPQLAAGDRLLVVADNCSDDTAAIALAAGAEVIERRDAARRGKGFALDFAVRHLERRPVEVVIVVDADCRVGAGAIERLARTCLHAARPVQALYVMRSGERTGARTRIAELAWRLKNQVRPLGGQRLAMPCQLMGSGMAFPWAVIRCAPLASGQIVEDLVLGLDLARSGTPPLFCPEARVTSSFPVRPEGARAQRMRWEHGHLALILGRAPLLLVEALRRGNAPLLAMAADLCVPPLALLLALILALLAASALLFAGTGQVLPMWLSAAALAMLVLAVLAAWARHGRDVISLGSLACAPVYALSKMPLYVAFLLKRQAQWVRSRRDAE